MRKASLNLSVNAIIIFVLAFAMLGVGIFVTNQLRDTAGSGLAKARELIGSIEQDPTAEDPLVGVGKDMDIPNNKREPKVVKFYNGLGFDLYNVSVTIDLCKDTESGDMFSLSNSVKTPKEYPVEVVSDDVDIKASNFGEIPFVMKKGDVLGSGNTYICKLQISGTEMASPPVTQIRHSHSFFLNVRS